MNQSLRLPYTGGRCGAADSSAVADGADGTSTSS
jgi:hypothetical protein